MTRLPQAAWDDRRNPEKRAFWKKHLLDLRDLYTGDSKDDEWHIEVAEYGGLHCLRTDIELLRNDLNNGEMK